MCNGFKSITSGMGYQLLLNNGIRKIGKEDRMKQMNKIYIFMMYFMCNTTEVKLCRLL